MKISQLQTFVAIVETGSFSAGARKQNVSQPAATFQIQALEESLGVKLIDRSSKALLLTEAGKLCYEAGKKIVDEVSLLKTELRGLADVIKGEFRIGASTIPGEYIVPLMLGEFKVDHPETKPYLEVADTELIIDHVNDGYYDLGIVGAKVDNKKLDFKRFVNDELIVIAHRDFATIGDEILKLSDIVSEPFIMREEGSGTRLVFERTLEKMGLTPKDIDITLELGSAEAIVTAVQAGLGLSVVSRWAADNALSLHKIKELKVIGFPIVRDLYIVTSKNRIMQNVAERFLQFMVESKERWQK